MCVCVCVCVCVCAYLCGCFGVAIILLRSTKIHQRAALSELSQKFRGSALVCLFLAVPFPLQVASYFTPRAFVVALKRKLHRTNCNDGKVCVRERAKASEFSFINYCQVILRGFAVFFFFIADKLLKRFLNTQQNVLTNERKGESKRRLTDLCFARGLVNVLSNVLYIASHHPTDAPCRA